MRARTASLCCSTPASSSSSASCCGTTGSVVMTNSLHSSNGPIAGAPSARFARTSDADMPSVKMYTIAPFARHSRMKSASILRAWVKRDL